MTLFELFVPRGALNQEQIRRLSERGRDIAWLVVHEPVIWTVGGRSVEADEPPRYIVRASLPGGHLNDGMRSEMIARITRVLAEVDPEPERLYREPRAWVHVIEVPDGNIGAFGQVMRTADIMRLVVNGKLPEAAAPDDEPARATLIDPICGMSVALTDTAITLNLDGVTYAFCSTACRDIFAEQRRLAASAP